MLIYLVRHAWAGHFGDPAWPDDFQRPLTKKGESRFLEVARALADLGVCPQVIATSPLVRCRQTAEILCRALGGSPPVVSREELEPPSDLEGLIGWVQREAGDLEQVAWVGHAPDVGRLAAGLIGDGSSRIRFSKGAVAAVEFDGSIEVGSGELRWLVTAKLLGY